MNSCQFYYPKSKYHFPYVNTFHLRQWDKKEGFSNEYWKFSEKESTKRELLEKKILTPAIHINAPWNTNLLFFIFFYN